MRQILFALLVALCAAPVVAEDPTPIEQRMSAEERKASGLEKLSPTELAALNAWLEANMSEKAIRKKMIGFPVMHLFGQTDDDVGPIVTRIDGEFNGWDGRTLFKLDNGQVWKQIDKVKLYVRPIMNPEVTIKPAMMGTWMLRVKGYNSSARVERVK